MQGGALHLARHLRRHEAIRKLQQKFNASCAIPSLQMPPIEVDIAMVRATALVVHYATTTNVDDEASPGIDPIDIGPRPTLARGYRYAKRDVDHDASGSDPPNLARHVDSNVVAVPVFPPRRLWHPHLPPIVSEHGRYFQLTHDDDDKRQSNRVDYRIRDGVVGFTNISHLDLRGAPLGLTNNCLCPRRLLTLLSPISKIFVCQFIFLLLDLPPLAKCNFRPMPCQPLQSCCARHSHHCPSHPVPFPCHSFYGRVSTRSPRCTSTRACSPIARIAAYTLTAAE